MTMNRFVLIAFAMVVAPLAGCVSDSDGPGDSQSERSLLDVELNCESTEHGTLCEAIPMPLEGPVDEDAYTYEWTTSDYLTFSENVTFPSLREVICVGEGTGRVQVVVTDTEQRSATAARSIRCQGQTDGQVRESGARL